MKKSKVKPSPKRKAKPVQKIEAKTAPIQAPLIVKPTRKSVQANTNDIAFWDTVKVGEEVAGKNLAKGEYADCKRSDIPETAWQQHLKSHREYANAGGKLQTEPEVIGLFRDDAGELGLLLGYKAA